MEVHAHTHTADPGIHRGRKKWTHYFWEFLMLFLAVFCGFLAEYQLEHKIEKERGKQYVQSFREDLCTDTAILHSNIETLKRFSAAGDSLVTMFQEGKIQSPAEVKKLYEYNITSLAGFTVVLTDRTSSQLKNSGGMRLITNKKVIDGIVDYWAGVEAIIKIENFLQTMRMQAREKSYLIFYNKYYSETSTISGRSILDNPQLMTKEHTLLAEFSNRVAHVKNMMKGTYTRVLKTQMTKADSLIKVIDKEYHLK